MPFITHFRVMAQLPVFLSVDDLRGAIAPRLFALLLTCLLERFGRGENRTRDRASFFGRVNLFTRTYRHQVAIKITFLPFEIRPFRCHGGFTCWFYPRECLAIDETKTVNNKVDNLDISSHLNGSTNSTLGGLATACSLRRSTFFFFIF